MRFTQSRWKTPGSAAALAGAFLDAALGADCFLAVYHLLGEIPACLFCGAVLTFWAVKGGALFAGRDSRSGMVLSLLPIIFWGRLANHLSFASESGDPSGVWEALSSPEVLTSRYWFRLGGNPVCRSAGPPLPAASHVGPPVRRAEKERLVRGGRGGVQRGQPGPEEIDSEYQAVFKEMEAVCGIEVSVMENLGKFSS